MKQRAAVCPTKANGKLPSTNETTEHWQIVRLKQIRRPVGPVTVATPLRSLRLCRAARRVSFSHWISCWLIHCCNLLFNCRQLFWRTFNFKEILSGGAVWKESAGGRLSYSQSTARGNARGTRCRGVIQSRPHLSQTDAVLGGEQLGGGGGEGGGEEGRREHTRQGALSTGRPGPRPPPSLCPLISRDQQQ